MEKMEETAEDKKIVHVDPSLDQYADQILFPAKLALAKERLKGVKLPENKKLK